jgi:hypothetical protein
MTKEEEQQLWNLHQTLKESMELPFMAFLKAKGKTEEIETLFSQHQDSMWEILRVIEDEITASAKANGEIPEVINILPKL